jgi:hypothetical protein
VESLKLKHSGEIHSKLEEKLVSQLQRSQKLLINNENFEADPNRNSLPYIKEYFFSPEWKIKEL